VTLHKKANRKCTKPQHEYNHTLEQYRIVGGTATTGRNHGSSDFWWQRVGIHSNGIADYLEKTFHRLIASSVDFRSGN